MTAMTYVIDDAIEEWREQAVEAGLDPSTFVILWEPNMVKDLARHISMKLRESGRE